ncbi:MAG TPA: TonB-dependent receptor, partial [Candidatus Brocadiales bacterium]|nr:TonB-dependent receptor [Candidatus Brocadiales bacterium]
DQRTKVTSLSPPSSLLLADTEDVNGGNVLLRWQRSPSEESDIILQAYFDNAERESRVLDQRIDTYDLDFQHRFLLGDRQEITWGMGYRLVSDELNGSFTVSFDPDERNAQLFSTFLQDQITIREDLWLTLGSKFEHNDYSGFEIQPSGRFLWQPLPRHTLWGAVSRAVRTPSRAEDDVTVNTFEEGVPILSSLRGNDGFESEDLLAYELGYRHQLTRRLSIDVAGFYNTYDNLLTVEPGALDFGTVPPHVPVDFDNLMDGETYGIELAADWQARRYWRLSSSYTWLKMNLHLDSASNDRVPEDRDDDVEGDSPEHQFQIHSYLNLPHNLEQDTALYYVSRLHSEEDISSYTRLDVRLGWHPRDDLELSLSVQNLLEKQNQENTGGAGSFFGSSEVPRSIYAKITWKF